jgi:hypothetical protein
LVVHVLTTRLEIGNFPKRKAKCGVINAFSSTKHIPLLLPPFPLVGWSGTQSTITEATTGPDDDCGATCGKSNRSIWRKLAPVPLCPPKIPRDLTRAGKAGN